MKKCKRFETAFDTFTSLKLIGEGGSGIVYEVSSSSGDRFALKQLRPMNVNNERLKRFKNEINFCQTVRHPNVLPIIDVGVVEDGSTKCPFYVMPLFPKTLRALLPHKICPEKVLTLFAGIIHGVEAAHLKSVWHRDLKPENILIDEAKSLIVVADFGIAHFTPDSSKTIVKTRTTTRLANFQYSAPEQRDPGGSISAQTDIYALGLILNEMFTGRVPQGTQYMTIGSVSPSHAYLDPLVERMIAQDQNARYPTIDDVKKDISIRAKQSLARQKLSDLSREVIPTTQVDDALVVHPPRIHGVDYENNALAISLSQQPNIEWINCFANPRTDFTFIDGICAPGLFYFADSKAFIDLTSQSERYAQQIIDLFKQYLANANKAYSNLKIAEARTRERKEKERLQQRIDDEERRKRLLDKLEF